MKEITKDWVREALERVMQWPAERQANLVQVIELAEAEYSGDRDTDE
jgi:hypothetical protein